MAEEEQEQKDGSEAAKAEEDVVDRRTPSEYACAFDES